MDHVICRYFGLIMPYFAVIYRHHADILPDLPRRGYTTQRVAPAYGTGARQVLGARPTPAKYRAYWDSQAVEKRQAETDDFKR